MGWTVLSAKAKEIRERGDYLVDPTDAERMLTLWEGSEIHRRIEPSLLPILHRDPPGRSLDPPGPGYAREVVHRLLAYRHEVFQEPQNPIAGRALGFSRLPAAGYNQPLIIQRYAFIKRTRPKRRGPLRCKKYRIWLHTQACQICHSRFTEACHTANNGMRSKGPDSGCLPLCRLHHAEYDHGRRAFEAKYELDMRQIAAAYWVTFEGLATHGH